ncbi:MAG: DUF4238 domain-containing protein [Clostridiales bacterium]
MIKERNHFVPQYYLKKWSNDNHTIWIYRTLVSHSKVKYWENKSIKGNGYYSYLYACTSNGMASDEIEDWLNVHFENPAVNTFRKVTDENINLRNIKLKKGEWQSLIKLCAAQLVRTPANFINSMEYYQRIFPKITKTALNKLIIKLKSDSSQSMLKGETEKTLRNLPIKVNLEKASRDNFTRITVNTKIGRAYWLSGIKYLLENTIKVLLNYNWRLLKVHEDIELFTSDNPAMCINYYEKNNYDFKGGWGNKNSEIIFPLSPKIILYTKVGESRKSHEELSYTLSCEINKMIAEHAFREIYAKDKVYNIQSVRKRIIDSEKFKQELDWWKSWHTNQGKIENEYGL